MKRLRAHYAISQTSMIDSGYSFLPIMTEGYDSLEREGGWKGTEGTSCKCHLGTLLLIMKSRKGEAII